MKAKLESIQKKTINLIKNAQSSFELEDIKIKILGKKGELTEILKGVGKLSPQERPLIGKLSNQVKIVIQNELNSKKQELESLELEQNLLNENIDPSLPSQYTSIGKLHPLTTTTQEIIDIFKRIGYSVETGPDIESDYYNFEALNIPADHPARDMHDTFYLQNGNLLRTHTSPVQIRTMEKKAPPLKIIVPGTVYRCDADVSHSPVFHQIEGLYVDKNVTFADLKGTLTYFIQELFGKTRKVRFRPSYFPFTEPSAELDVECIMCNGVGCNVCKKTGWLEILGCGMVNKNVFRAVDIDPEKYTGLAFGMGIERISMLKYRISDIRLFYENDIRFLEQF